MSYRGFPYFVTQSVGSDHRCDPYASQRHRMPDRPCGIRHVSSPLSRQRIRSYKKPDSILPVKTALGGRTLTRPALDVVEPVKLLISLFLIASVALGLAFAGILTTQNFIGFVNNAAASETARSAEEGLSTPRADWEQGSVPALYQTDSRWAAETYSGDTLGTAGAAPLCLTMVRIDLTGDTSVGPDEVATIAQQANYDGTQDTEALLTKGASLLGLTSRTVNPNELTIRRELVAGRPVIASVSSDAFGQDATCIVLTGIDEHSSLEIRDPQSSVRTAKHWKFSDIISASTHLYSYSAAS